MEDRAEFYRNNVQAIEQLLLEHEVADFFVATYTCTLMGMLKASR